MAAVTSSSGNVKLAIALGSLYGNELSSDCDIIFCAKETRVLSDVDEDDLSPADGLDTDDQTATTVSKYRALCPPMPGHSLVLWGVSDRLRPQIEGQHSAVWSGPPSSRPVLHIPLASNEEVPSARAAIRCGYTGHVDEDLSIREVLEVRRQAVYMDINSCGDVCDQLIRSKVADASGENVLAFFACYSLWPAGNNAGFAPVYYDAKARLVKHFGDTRTIFSKHSLREQMLALPASGMEALLSSDHFGTDTECSVLLMLAMWTEANFHKVDCWRSRERLCCHIRLVQLRPLYASRILPMLACAYENSPRIPADWFPISLPAATLVYQYASADPHDRSAHLQNAVYNTDASWFNTTPRRQCLPTPNHHDVRWVLPDPDVLDEATERVLLPGRLAGSGDSCWTGFGLQWSAFMSPGEGLPEVYVLCEVPSVFHALGLSSDLSTGSPLAPPIVPQYVAATVEWCNYDSRQGFRMESHEPLMIPVGSPVQITTAVFSTIRVPSSRPRDDNTLMLSLRFVPPW